MVQKTEINLLFGFGKQNSNLHNGQYELVQLRSQMVPCANRVIILWQLIADQVFVRRRTENY